MIIALALILITISRNPLSLVVKHYSLLSVFPESEIPMYLRVLFQPRHFPAPFSATEGKQKELLIDITVPLTNAFPMPQ